MARLHDDCCLGIRGSPTGWSEHLPRLPPLGREFGRLDANEGYSGDFDDGQDYAYVTNCKGERRVVVRLAGILEGCVGGLRRPAGHPPDIRRRQSLAETIDRSSGDLARDRGC
jgi:hypothetical protein